ncbi:MAG: hypothetical protein JSW00_01770 [Thermoplasmata archaeon]|nr:MAG: hypothetical protein JSW00_01770 [Thermoplasmata archaeon]
MSLEEDVQIKCPSCDRRATFIKENNRYYCFSCNKYVTSKEPGEKEEEREAQPEPEIKETAEYLCPKCNQKAAYIQQYNRYYCYTCNFYLEITEEEGAAAPEGTEVAEEIKEPYEEAEAEVAEGVLTQTEEQEMEDYLSDLDELTGTEAQEESLFDKQKERFSNYRYRTRMIKGSILPILFGVISIQMLNSYVYQFPYDFEHQVMIILGGFLLGFGAISGITIVNMIRAKKNPTNGIELKVLIGVVAYIPFILILMTLALFDSIYTAWQFSTGFFLASIFPILFVMLFELSSKGKFFVRELADDPSSKRKLVFVQ